MKPIRREALVRATIAEIGAVGSLDVTVGAIARRAGMSSALAHHYFGGKEDIFLAAMQHILTEYGTVVRAHLARVTSPRGRVEAIVRGSFAEANFRPDTISAWLNFYVQAQTSKGALRLLRIYQRRLRSNLRHELRPLAGGATNDIAEAVAALIDGVYIRASLGAVRDADQATRIVLGYLDQALPKQAN